MGAAAARGMGWMFASNLSAKVLTVVAQVVALAVLSQEQMGLFALALAVQMFVQTFRDGGLREWLVARAERYGELSGTTYWLAFTINCAVALLLVGAGWVVGWAYQAPELIWLMVVSASALPLGTPAVILSAKLRLDHRFKDLARISALSAFARYSSQIVFCLTGFGAMAMVLPIVVNTVVEWWLTIRAERTPPRPWRQAAEPSRWRGILTDTIWLILASSTIGIVNQGYLALSGFEKAELGQYNTAVLVLMQVETLLTMSIMAVALPVFTRQRDDTPRLASTALRLVRSMALLGAVLCGGAAVTFPHIETAVFGGKWSEVALPLAILAVAYPLRTILLCVPHCLLQAQHRFRDLFFLWLRNCIGLLTVTLLAGRLWPTPTGLATFVAAYLALTSLLSTTLTLRPLGISATSTLRACLAALLLAGLAGAAAWATGRVATPTVALLADTLAPARALADGLIGPPEPSRLAVLIRGGVLAAVCGGVFSVLMVALLRLVLPGHLRDLLGVLPARLAGPAGKVLRLG
jgi:O-antigen/teichoic acid export membrane protein